MQAMTYSYNANGAVESVDGATGLSKGLEIVPTAARFRARSPTEPPDPA